MRPRLNPYAIALCCAAGLLLNISSIWAQNTFPTTNTDRTNSAVQMCVNAAGVAVPQSINGYPCGATPIASAAVGTTGAVVATLAAVAAKTTYICGFSIHVEGTGGNVPTITGLVNAQTFSFRTTATAAGVQVVRHYQPCLPGNAVNTAVVVTYPANASATNVNVNAFGFQQ